MVENEGDDRPIVSVVVASFSGEPTLARCLQSILTQRPQVEIIVASNAPDHVVTSLLARYPTVRFFCAPHGSSVFQLRALGVQQARGRLIVLTEDHCTVSPNWLEAFIAAHRGGHGIVGGPVDNGLNRGAYDWALYFCEYGQYLPPLPDGPSRALSGLNVAYDRELLMSCGQTWEQALYENEVHDVLCSRGHRLYSLSSAWVKSHLQMTLREAMAHLFGGGRHFGLYRRLRSSPAQRAFWIVTSPVVPFVLFGRLVRRVWLRNPRRLLKMWWCLPYMLCLLAAWSTGEALGYIAPKTMAQVANQPQET